MTLNRGTSRVALALAVLAIGASHSFSQQSTNTNCTTVGSNTNCTSTTTDYDAQQRRAYEQGQQIGNALGQGIAGAMQAHSFNKGLKKYCDAHPGEIWHYGRRATGDVYSSGRCPTEEQIAVEAANTFMARHRDYIANQTNSKFITDYLDSHRLDPRREKSYEVAYKGLKKTGKLVLYAR
jgi:hypothetical protein